MKKGQEEMVGFVLIVVLVAVIALIFLGIQLRSSLWENVSESKEIESFLFSLEHYTTECEIPSNIFLDLGDVIVKCYKREICENNGKSACEVLENELEQIIGNSSYIVEEGSRVSYYEIRVYSELEKKRNLIKPINKALSGEVGECRGEKIYNSLEVSTVNFEDLKMELEVCYV
jgi:hypothetical protein